LIHNNLELKATLAAIYAAAGDQANYLRVTQAAQRQAIEWKWVAPEHSNNPRNAFLLAQMACYDLRSSPPSEQVQAWAQQARQAQPRVPWHSHAMGLVELRKGEPQVATESFRTSLKAVPGWRPGLNSLALALAMFATRDPQAKQQAADALDDTNWLDLDASEQPLLPSVWPLREWLELRMLREKVKQQSEDYLRGRHAE
jgi:hypothetical protein